MDVGFDFGAFLQEFLGMLQLELKVMVIRIGTKPDLLDHGFLGIGLDFLLFLALVVEELVELNDPAYWRISVLGDHDEILAHLFCPGAHLAGRVYAWRDFFAGDLTDFVQVIAHKANFGNPDIGIELELVSLVVLSLVRGMESSGQGFGFS